MAWAFSIVRDGRRFAISLVTMLLFRNPRFLTLASLVVFLNWELPFPDPIPVRFSNQPVTVK